MNGVKAMPENAMVAERSPGVFELRNYLFVGAAFQTLKDVNPSTKIAAGKPLPLSPFRRLMFIAYRKTKAPRLHC
jgi:hypothetical protein